MSPFEQFHFRGRPHPRYDIYMLQPGLFDVRLPPPTPRMDTSLYPTFPQPSPRCPKSLPRLTTSVAFTRRNSGGETPATPTTTVNFTTFLSAKSTVLRVAATGNHPSPATAARTLLTEIGDVRLIPSPRPLARHPRPSSDWACITGVGAVTGLDLGGEDRVVCRE
jgi:hypothetical protein